MSRFQNKVANSILRVELPRTLAFILRVNENTRTDETGRCTFSGNCHQISDFFRQPVNHSCQSWKVKLEFQPLDQVWIKTGWKFVSDSEHQGSTKGYNTLLHWHFEFISQQTEIILSQNGWAHELLQGPLRLKGDAHFDPWTGWSRKNHTSLQIASKCIRLYQHFVKVRYINGIGIKTFRMNGKLLDAT